MNLPRRLTSVMSESLSFLLNAEGVVGAISFGSVTSAATMRRPTTTRRSARTTCSTSGSSGIWLDYFTTETQRTTELTQGNQPVRFRSNDRFDLGLDAFAWPWLVGFEVQPQQRLRI